MSPLWQVAHAALPRNSSHPRVASGLIVLVSHGVSPHSSVRSYADTAFATSSGVTGTSPNTALNLSLYSGSPPISLAFAASPGSPTAMLPPFHAPIICFSSPLARPSQ